MGGNIGIDPRAQPELQRVADQLGVELGSPEADELQGLIANFSADPARISVDEVVLAQRVVADIAADVPRGSLFEAFTVRARQHISARVLPEEVARSSAKRRGEVMLTSSPNVETRRDAQLRDSIFAAITGGGQSPLTSVEVSLRYDSFLRAAPRLAEVHRHRLEVAFARVMPLPPSGTVDLVDTWATALQTLRDPNVAPNDVPAVDLALHAPATIDWSILGDPSQALAAAQLGFNIRLALEERVHAMQAEITPGGLTGQELTAAMSRVNAAVLDARQTQESIHDFVTHIAHEIRVRHPDLDVDAIAYAGGTKPTIAYQLPDMTWMVRPGRQNMNLQSGELFVYTIGGELRTRDAAVEMAFDSEARPDADNPVDMDAQTLAGLAHAAQVSPHVGLVQGKETIEARWESDLGGTVRIDMDDEDYGLRNDSLNAHMIVYEVRDPMLRMYLSNETAKLENIPYDFLANPDDPSRVNCIETVRVLARRSLDAIDSDIRLFENMSPLVGRHRSKVLRRVDPSIRSADDALRVLKSLRAQTAKWLETFPAFQSVDDTLVPGDVNLDPLVRTVAVGRRVDESWLSIETAKAARTAIVTLMSDEGAAELGLPGPFSINRVGFQDWAISSVGSLAGVSPGDIDTVSTFVILDDVANLIREELIEVNAEFLEANFRNMLPAELRAAAVTLVLERRAAAAAFINGTSTIPIDTDSLIRFFSTPDVNPRAVMTAQLAREIRVINP